MCITILINECFTIFNILEVPIMENLVVCVIPILFGIYMFTQPDNFYEHTKLRRKGRVETGDPTKLDYTIIRGAGIFFIGAGIVLAIKILMS